VHYGEKVYADRPPAEADARRWAAERSLRAFGAPGEYEPLSLVVFPPEGATGVLVTVGDLTGPEGAKIPAAAVDVRWVKCWYDALGGYVIYDRNARFYGPELLVKDPRWLVSDPQTKTNSLTYRGLPAEPAQLQPVHLPRGFVQQAWLTVHIPDDARPGAYTGEVQVTAREATSTHLLQVEVLGLHLLPPAKHNSLYTGSRGDLSEEVHRAQDHNMKEHGLTVGYVYEVGPDYPKNDFSAFQRRLRLYEDAGLISPELMLLTASGVSVWNEQPTPEFIAEQKEKAAKLVAYLRQQGYPGEIFVYGADEWSGPNLAQAAKTYHGIAEGGARVCCACGSDYFRYAGTDLHLPIVGVDSTRLSERHLAAIARSHAAGLDVWSYVPFTTMAEPVTFRYRLGFWFWNAPLEGTCLWAYMDKVDASVYDNWGEESAWRNSMLAYPTAHGVIDTIQWEGYREGVDDVRYASTLLAMVLEAERRGIGGPDVDQAKALCLHIQVANDDRLAGMPPTRWAQGVDLAAFDAQRRELADRIVALKAAHPELDPAQIAADPTWAKRVREFLKTTYPNLRGTPPYGYAEYPPLRAALAESIQQKDWARAVQQGWDLIHGLEAARAGGKIDAVQYGALLDDFVDEFHEAELEFVRTPGPDGKFVPGQIGQTYDLLAELNGLEWKIKPDWFNVGERDGWYKPELDETDWRKVDVTKFWEQQGYEDLLDLDGVGWYRMKFEVPAAAQGKRLFLHFGGVDEWATVYLNGERVDTHPGYSNAWARPFQMEITRLVRAGQANVLAVRVRDTQQAGGLWAGLEQLGPWRGVKLLAGKE
jgi:hypothetical protein